MRWHAGLRVGGRTYLMYAFLWAPGHPEAGVFYIPFALRLQRLNLSIVVGPDIQLGPFLGQGGRVVPLRSLDGTCDLEGVGIVTFP